MSMTSFDPTTAEEVATDLRDAAVRQRYCTWLQYWLDCVSPACRRAHACAGDPTACFLGRYMRLSAAARVWVIAGIHALDLGLTARNAAGAADLALLQHVKTAERLPRHPPRRKRWRPIRPHAEERCEATRHRKSAVADLRILNPISGKPEIGAWGRPILRDGRVPRPPQDEGR